MKGYWDVSLTKEADKDYNSLDASVRRQVDKAILKVAKNPLTKAEGGYGEPLGNKHGFNLTGLSKIVLKKLGIRIIYRAIRDGEIMRIIVVAARADEEAYEIAAARIVEE